MVLDLDYILITFVTLLTISGLTWSLGEIERPLIETDQEDICTLGNENCLVMVAFFIIYQIIDQQMFASH